LNILRLDNLDLFDEKIDLIFLVHFVEFTHFKVYMIFDHFPADDRFTASVCLACLCVCAIITYRYVDLFEM